MKILIIEPHQLLGATYQQALARAGHDAAWCRDAQAAIQTADAAPPDVIVLELQLPRYSGVEFLYELRSYAEWQDIPVVLHTLVPASRLASSRHHFVRLGVSAYLYKPTTTLQQLTRAVNEAALTLA